MASTDSVTEPGVAIKANTQVLFYLFLASLAIRLLLWGPVVFSGTKLVADENGYFARAAAFKTLLVSALEGKEPPNRIRQRAYGEGVHPPLHSILLTIPFFLFGTSAAVARITVVLLSALTTPLVYSLTLKLSTKKAAPVAALAHMFFPTFLAYSHYLWSETTCVLFLVLALHFSLLLLESPSTDKLILYASLAGFSLGLMALTRAATLPFLLVIPLFLPFLDRGSRLRILGAVLMVVAAFVVLLPWLVVLASFEKRLVPVSTSGEFNLFLGNNPWEKSGEFDPQTKPHVRQAIRQYSQARGVSEAAASRSLAFREITADPGAFVRRCFHRLRILWLPDRFILRHIFHVAYPPLTKTTVLLILVVLLVCHFSFVGMGWWGLLTGRPALRQRGLLLGLILIGMLLPLVTVADTRSCFPFLALMLPAIGHGATTIFGRRTNRLRALPALIALVLVFGLNAFTYPSGREFSPRTSSYYWRLTTRLDEQFGSSTSVVDRVVLRVKPPIKEQRLTIALLGSGYEFQPTGNRSIDWYVSPRAKRLRLQVFSSHPTKPLRLRLTPETGRATIIEPITREAWHKWIPSGLQGIEYIWPGGGQ